jgi:hypothetical protein
MRDCGVQIIASPVHAMGLPSGHVPIGSMRIGVCYGRMRPMDLECFKHWFPFGSCCDKQQDANGVSLVTIAHVMEQVVRGNAECPGCRARRDLRESLRHMHLFGRPEALFGLQIWSGSFEWPASTVNRVEIVDVRKQVPYDGKIIYANVTPQTHSPNMTASDWVGLLAPQDSYTSWPLVMRFYVPSGSQHRVAITFVVKPSGPMPLPRELALQAVSNFHHQNYNVASILLAASVEASLRGRVNEPYATRGVQLPSDLGFAGLVERARLHFNPQFGPKLVDNLKQLAKMGRNPAAHGVQATEISREDVAMWMVDAAVVYEWSRHAELAVK